MASWFKEFAKGVIVSNPTFVMALGLCPSLAVTNSLDNALGMSAAVLFVLLCSNILVSFLRTWVANIVRIPTFIVIIATFVTIVSLTFQAYVPALYESLGIYLPLIVVNCIILGRAEAFAS
ncbi:MAG: Rnf-Nqr domain containing protein, partial [Dehalococcoidales bacterium]